MKNDKLIPAVVGVAVDPIPAAPVAMASVAMASVAAAPIAGMSNIVMQQSDVQVIDEESSNASVIKAASILPGIPRVTSDSALVGPHSLQVYAQDHPLSYGTTEDLIN